ncbi:fiber-2 [Pigeon adenovirus 1]|uniref:Fiber-2 n=1 Tax=Pigeon adenovirus 1 TaxID=764030 RepID=X5M217_9ADEN|nr:fiber-2 [Pigeon adenovirus 1]CDO33912.1 fiber-2 [Pigeon adenovirus 1]
MPQPSNVAVVAPKTKPEAPRKRQLSAAALAAEQQQAERRRRKRLRRDATDPDLNLVYPFWYTVEDPHVVNPPFLAPTGPLYDDNGNLNIRLTPPVTLVEDGVGLAYDQSLKVSDATGAAAGVLGVQVDTEGPLTVTEDGLDLNTDDSLAVNDDWQLGVRFAENQPFSVTTAGVSLLVDDTLLIAAADEETPTSYELGVHLNQNGPITADADGIDLEVDNQTLQVTTNEQSQGVLAVKLKQQGGLSAGTSGIGINYDNEGALVVSDNTLQLKIGTDQPFSTTNGLSLNYDPNSFTVSGVTTSGTTTTMSQLAVKVASSNPLGKDNSGLKLVYNTQDFFDDNSSGLSAVTPIQYLSPYCTYSAGSPGLDTFDVTVRSSSGENWTIAAYVVIANSGGICNGILYLHFDKKQLGTLGTGQGGETGNYLRCAIVVNPSGNPGGNHSNFSNPRWWPEGSNSFLTPPGPPNAPPVNAVVSAIGRNNWYYGPPWRGVEVKLKSRSTNTIGSTTTVTNTDAVAYYLPATAQGSNGNPNVIYFIYEVKFDWYNGTTNNGMGVQTSDPIPFSYLGSLPQFPRNSTGTISTTTTTTTTVITPALLPDVVPAPGPEPGTLPAPEAGETQDTAEDLPHQPPEDPALEVEPDEDPALEVEAPEDAAAEVPVVDDAALEEVPLEDPSEGSPAEDAALPEEDVAPEDTSVVDELPPPPPQEPPAPDPEPPVTPPAEQPSLVIVDFVADPDPYLQFPQDHQHDRIIL